MTHRSESRGIMYTAPPSGEDDEEVPRTQRSDSGAPESETRESPVLEPTTSTTDANWTGTVPADD